MRAKAPAGTNDSRAASCSDTQPAVTLNKPDPSSSTCSVYAHPRSIAVADGVSTTNWPGGAVMTARSVPLASAKR